VKFDQQFDGIHSTFQTHSESDIAVFNRCQMTILVSSLWVQEGQVELSVCDNVGRWI
jgi:hypothetical protein